MSDSSHTTQPTTTGGNTHQPCCGRTFIGLLRDSTSVRTNHLRCRHAEPVFVRCPPSSHDCAKVSPNLRRIAGRDNCRNLRPEQEEDVIGLGEPVALRPPNPK